MAVTIPRAEPPPVTMGDRHRALEQNIAYHASRGWRLVSQGQTQAQMVKGKHTSHLLHLVLSILTLGLWVPVWIAVSVFAGEKKLFITVDEHGQVRAVH